MAESSSYALLGDLAVIIVSATVCMRLFSFLKLPQLLAFIVVGILLSPVFGVIKEKETITELGELGVMLMMFFVGMEFDLERLKKVFAPSVLGITFQILGMGALGIAIASLMGLTGIDGVFLGGVLAMSSTIVIVEIFAQRRDLNKPYAQIAIGILIIEDLFAVFLLVILSGLADGKPDIYKLGQSTLVMSAFVISIFVIGKLSVPPMLKKLAFSRNPQEMIMFTFCLILGLGFLAVVSGLSLALGAFLAGSIISGTVLSEKVEQFVTPFRNLFVALFFVSVGTMIDPRQILDLWLPIIAISISVIVLQTFACFVGIVLGGARCKDAYLAAINKAQIGEFSFVVAGLGLSLGVMDSSIMTIAMGVSFLTVFVNPFLSGHSDKVIAFFEKIVPSKIKTAFDIYHDSFCAVAETAQKSQNLKLVLSPLTKILIYSLLFCALMFAAPYLSGVVETNASLAKYSKPIMLAMWAVVAVVALPIIAGIITNLEETISRILEISTLGGSMKATHKARLARFINGVFSLVIILTFAAIYLGIISYYLPLGELSLLGASVFLVAGFFLRKFVINMKQSLEGRFSGVVKRNLENAMHHRRDMMLARIKKNYKWAIEISEIEISELAAAAGKSVGELGLRAKTGSEIVAIRRGAFVIYNISAQTFIFPDDVVVLSGTPEANAKAEKMLSAMELDFDEAPHALSTNYELKTFEVPTDSALAGQSLGGADLNRKFGVKILAISRAGTDVRPSAAFAFKPEDKMLAMGGSEKLSAFANDFSLREVQGEVA